MSLRRRQWVSLRRYKGDSAQTQVLYPRGETRCRRAATRASLRQDARVIAHSHACSCAELSRRYSPPTFQEGFDGALG